MSNNADELSPANEQVDEKPSKGTEKVTKKAEVKPAKSNKKLKEEEKKLSKFNNNNKQLTNAQHVLTILAF